MASVPAELRPLFWDANIQTLDTAKHKTYIIERVLEFGDEEAYRWLFGTYTSREIIAVVKSSRRLSRPTAMMMANFYNLPEGEARCLQKPSGPAP
ncbi:MAG: hypothetical protein AB1426_11070 [Bacillota bacterium]